MSTSKVTYLRNLRTECSHVKSRKSIQTDAPTDNNGKGENFSPTDLLATSLAACAITIMGIKAEQNNWDLEVEADVEKIMSASPRKVSAINIEFTFNSKHDEKQKQILIACAKTCPVYLSISNETEKNMKFNFMEV